MPNAFADDCQAGTRAPGEKTAPGKWTGRELSGRWMNGKVPSGGFCASLLMVAIGKEFENRDGSVKKALSAGCLFLDACVPGPYEVTVDVIKAGRSVSTAQASLVQDGREKIRVLATFGAPKAEPSSTTLTPDRAAPPMLPPVEQCTEPFAEGGTANAPDQIRDRIVLMLAPDEAKMMTGVRAMNADGTVQARDDSAKSKDAKAAYQGYMKFRDDSPITRDSLLPFADASIPPVLAVSPGGWVPTMSWSAVLLKDPNPSGWLKFKFSSRQLHDGFTNEEGEIWDSDGNLVALTQQLAMFNPAQQQNKSKM